MDAALEKKLREMVDRQEIWEVMLRFGRGLDRVDRELVRSCYFDDTIEDHSLYVGGPDGFIDWAHSVTLQFKAQQHGLMNHRCELDGDDAHCETYFMFIGVNDKPPHFMSTGRYVDHFQRRNGEWRIANRVTIIEGRFDLSDYALGPQVDASNPRKDSPTGARDRSDASYQRPVRPRQPLPKQ